MARSHGNKYHAKKVQVDGLTFDSQREYKRWRELQWMEQREGAISDLQRQGRFCLIPAQRIDGKLVERACNYVADFVYTTSDGTVVVEDCKGHRTPEYIIKRKLMLYVHNIRVLET